MHYIWDINVDHILSANTSTVAAIVPDFDEIIEAPLAIAGCRCGKVAIALTFQILTKFYCFL